MARNQTDVQVSSLCLKVMGRCGRCQMIGVDQKSATRTQEPLRSLSECRSGKVCKNKTSHSYFLPLIAFTRNCMSNIRKSHYFSFLLCSCSKVTFGVYLAHQSARNSAISILSIGDHVIPQISESTEKL